MPVNGTARGYFTDLVKGVMTADAMNAMQYNYATVEVTHAGSLPTLGVPVVWDDTASTFIPFNTASVAEIAAAIAAGTSPLPNKAPVAVVVGNAQGAGFDPKDVDYTSGLNVTVLFRGEGSTGVVAEGLGYVGTTSEANKLVFQAQLEKQGIMVIESAETVTPTYTS